MGDASSAAGAIGAAVVNGLFANAQAVKSYKFTKALQKQAAKLNYNYSQLSAKTTPSASRIGLEKAGYNPMLAVQNATSGANSSWTSAQSGPNVNYTDAISSGVSSATDLMRLRNETAQSESVVKLNDAQSRKNISEAINNEIKNSYLDSRERAEIGKVRGETAKLENEIAYNNAYLEYLDQSLAVQEKLGLSGIDVQRRGQDITYNASGIEDYSDRAKRYKEWGSRHPYLRNVDETISRYLGNSPVSFSKKLK